MYLLCNEEKSVVAETFIRTLRNKVYKHMTAALKNVYFDVLDDIVDKYNNTYHSTIKMNSMNSMLSLMKKILNFKWVIM